MKGEPKFTVEEVSDLMRQRGTLRRLVREALPRMRDASWLLHAERALSVENWNDDHMEIEGLDDVVFDPDKATK